MCDNPDQTQGGGALLPGNREHRRALYAAALMDGLKIGIAERQMAIQIPLIHSLDPGQARPLIVFNESRCECTGVTILVNTRR